VIGVNEGGMRRRRFAGSTSLRDVFHHVERLVWRAVLLLVRIDAAKAGANRDGENRGATPTAARL
jgi:hypothetical protein